jgi:hypothetical protein
MKKTLAIGIFSILVSGIYAQQKPDYEKKIFISPEGKLFVNKDLPLYLWLSTSPDEHAQKYRLKSEETTQYSNPMYLDTEGYNTFRSPSAVDTNTRKTVYPLRDIIFEVYADGIKPSTKLDYGKTKPYVDEGKTYVQNNTQVELIASDDHSGVESINFSMNGSGFVAYTTPITFTEEKEYVLKYYAVDHVGNVEDTKEITFIYDKTAPVSKLNVTTDEHEQVVSGRSKIELSAEDVGIGVKHIIYQLDEGKKNTYQYPISASWMNQGEHTIKYFATDKVGNEEPVKTYSFYIDKTAPTIIEEVIAKTFFANGKEYASGKAQLKLTAFDNKAGVKEIRYSINNGEYQLYEKPVFMAQSSGNMNIKTYAIDNVNNKSQSQTANQKTSIPYIDLSGPSIHHNFSEPNFSTRDTLFINSKTKIYLKGGDSEAGVNRIEYRIDGNENIVYDKAFSISEEGVHTISYVGYDNVENTSSNSFMVKVDNIGPEISHKFSTLPTGHTNGLENLPKYVILYLSGTDSQTGVQSISYGFGDHTTKIYTVPVTGFSLGEKKMTISAKDKLGNTTTEELHFNITED